MIIHTQTPILATLSIALLCSIAGISGANAAGATDPATVKAQADAETAVWNAETAKSQAEAAAAKAQFGPLADYTSAGTTSAGANSGKLEVTLMAMDVTKQIAKKILDDISGLAQCTSHNNFLVIVSEADKFNFDSYDAFQMQMKYFEDKFLEEKKAYAKPNRTGEITASAIALPAVATVVSIVGNLLRSNYNLSDVDLNSDDVMVAKAIVAQKPGCSILIPDLYTGPLNLSANSNPAYNKLAALNTLRSELDSILTRIKEKKDAASKAEATDITTLENSYDDYIAKIETADDKGVVPFAVIAHQAIIADKLQNGAFALILKANVTGGSTYTKQNFWTFLGSMPFYVSGGAVASYTLVNGRTGLVVAADIVGYSRQFDRIDDVDKHYAPPAD